MSEASILFSPRALLALPNDDRRKIIFVALALCLVCSILVSTAAVMLRPLQESNAQYARKLEILKVAGLPLPEDNLDAYFAKRVQTRIVNLDSGEYSEDMQVDSFDERNAARQAESSIVLSAEQDLARIKRRANYARVYIIPDQQGRVEQIVFPVHGYGLWSTMYGFLALSADGKTIKGLTFYEQAETAGLGAEVANPRWLAQFAGKQAVDPQGKPLIRVNKGPVDPGAAYAGYTVDGLSGATLTSQGVTNLLHFWLDEMGFGPYLSKVRNKTMRSGL